MRRKYIRQDNWPEVFQKAKAEAFLKGHTELYQWLNKYSKLDCNGPRIKPRKIQWAFTKDLGRSKNPPIKDFRPIIKQARSMGIKCTAASKDYLGSMHLKDYFPA